MLKEGKFGAAEGISVATVVVTTKIFLDTPRHFVEIGKTGAWLVPVVATSVGLIGFLFLALFMKQYPNGTLVEAVEKTLGPAMGSAVNYFYLVIFITFTSISLRQFAEYIILLALPLFPLSVTVILFIIPMVITVIIGLESIARSLYIASPFMLAAVFIVLFLLYPYYNIYNIFPLLGSPLKILAGGLLQSSIFIEILFLALTMPVFQGWQNFFKIGSSSIVLSGLIYTIFMFTLILVFPHEAAVELTSPYYSMARSVFLGRFFQRLESLFLVIWVIIGVGKLSLFYYGCLIIAARIWRLKDYKPLIPAFTVIVIALAMAPSNMQVISFVKIYILTNYGWIPAFGMPSLLLPVAVWQKKRKSGRKAA